jgi:hypothetical protein
MSRYGMPQITPIAANSSHPRLLNPKAPSIRPGPARARLLADSA